MKHKKCLVIKSNMVNALLPGFLRHLWYNLAFALFLGGGYYLIGLFFDWEFGIFDILYFLFVTLFFSFVKIVWDLVRILSTEYRFYARHLEFRYSFFRRESHSINYSQISDIEVRMTLWDRICGVGDLIIYTSNEDYNDKKKDFLRIRDIKNPEHIKSQIISRVHL